MPFNAIDDGGNYLSCPECGSSHLNRQGYKRLRNGENKQRWKCQACAYKTIHPARNSKDSIVENVRLSKQKQSYQDRNRVERKSFREYVRLENAVTELNTKLIKRLEEQKFTTLKKAKIENPKCVGVLQLSDNHLNERVDLPHNTFNYTVAGKRLKLLVERAKTFFSTYKVTNVLIAFTGDLLNSDRRLDEYLTNSGNRSGALFCAVDLYQQLITDMLKDFNLSVLSVSGNESRVKDDYGWVDVVATDNYDHTIVNMLRYLFKQDQVSFIDGDPMEKIDYVVSGHVHSARVGDTFSRSASLVGANDYSEKALNLEGRASQNCFVFHQNGNRDGMRVDLNNVDDVKSGYEVPPESKEYHSKSYEKLREPTTILKIQV